MQLTERDKRILEAVHAFDGILSLAQIQRLFFTGKSQAEQRLKFLYQHSYLARPNEAQRRRLSEMVYWLDKKGADIVASLRGTPLPEFYVSIKAIFVDQPELTHFDTYQSTTAQQSAQVLLAVSTVGGCSFYG